MGLMLCVGNTKWTLRFLHFFTFAKRGFHIILHGIDGNNMVNDFNANVTQQPSDSLPSCIKWGQHPSFAPSFNAPVIQSVRMPRCQRGCCGIVLRPVLQIFCRMLHAPCGVLHGGKPRTLDAPGLGSVESARVG